MTGHAGVADGHELDALSQAASDGSGIVQACVALAQALAAFRGGFDADPDGDSFNAFLQGEPFKAQADALLVQLTLTPALQPVDLEAKARLVPLVLGRGDGSITPEERAFVLAFAADVPAVLARILPAQPGASER